MRPVYGIVAGATLALVPAVALRGQGGAHDAWQLGVGLAAVAAVVLGARLHRTREPRPWWLVAAALALLAAADVAIVVGNHAGAAPAYPGSSDLLRLAAYPLLATGLLVFVRRRTPAHDWGAILDAAVVAVGIASVLWVLVLESVTEDASLSLPAKAVSVAFLVAGILLVGIVVRLVVTTGLGVASTAFIAAATIVQLVVDELYVVGRLDGWYEAGSAIDMLRLAVPVLWASAALHPTMRQLTRLVEEPESWPIRRRIALLACAVVVTAAMVVAGSLPGPAGLSVVTVAAAVLLLLLVSARLGTVVVALERSVVRAEVLQAGAAALVAARSREEVWDVASDTAASLAGGPRHAYVEVELSAHPRLAVRDAVVVGGGDVGAELRGDIRREGSLGRLGTARTFIVPLVLRGRLRGVLRLTSLRPLAWHLHRALATLASQASLALESVELAEDVLERRSEARFRTLVQNSTDIIAVLEEDLTIRYVTPSARAMLGFEPSDLVGTGLGRLLDRSEVPEPEAQLRDAARPHGVLERELRLRRADGSWRTVEGVISDLLGDPSVRGLVLTAHDVTERRELEDRLTHQAFHDALTGLPNRALLTDRVGHALERAKRSGATVALLFLDLDDFKTVNDSLGHLAGDELLVHVAERLRQHLRASDTPARIGGDEFALLLGDARGVEGAGGVAERLLGELAKPIAVGQTDVLVRASIGIVVARPGQTAGELLRNADIAMYWAKQCGGHRYQVFEPQMHEAALTRLELKADLERAFQAGEFDLAFQPIVDLESGRVVALETLLRWTHSTRGTVAPAEFIRIVEETGLINDIGLWVLEQACAQTRAWQVSVPGQAQLSVYVNLSARQILRSQCTEEVARTLFETGLSPSHVVLEITESTLMEDVEGVSARLTELRGLGLRIAIDDFGTGFSSLGYLQRFPVDELKIAKEFVDAVVDSRRTRLVEAIIALARSLDLGTVAEGIEQTEQRDRLLGLGCTLGQGFLFSRPVSAADVPRLLSGPLADVVAQEGPSGAGRLGPVHRLRDEEGLKWLPRSATT